MKKYLAEFVGTFALSFVVLLAVANGSTIIAIPVIAGLTLALFVYTIGAVSGCHINPAVTLGLLSIKKVSTKDAVYYIISQMAAAFVAIIIAKFLGLSNVVGISVWSTKVFFAEMVGTFFFAFGIASVVYGKIKESMTGLVIGGSLLFGILIAVFAGSDGILNPAVATALSSLTLVYLLAPIVGSVLGFHVYKYIIK